MRYRYIVATFILLAAMLQAAAQALTDRYNRQRPVVIVCSENPPYSFVDKNGMVVGRYVDNSRAIMNQLKVPCKFIIKEQAEARKAFEKGDADLIIADGRNYDNSVFCMSENIDFRRISADSVAVINFIGKDRQLMEQINDHFMRLKQNGDIAMLESRWKDVGDIQPTTAPTALYIIAASLLMTVFLALFYLLTLCHIRRTKRTSAMLEKMTDLVGKVGKYYATEDSQDARDLEFRHDAILCDPFLAIAFYDKNGQLIVENEAMKELGNTSSISDRQPLYNAKGELTNYCVTIRCPSVTT